MESKTYILFGNEYKCETERIEYFRMYNAENEIYKSFIQCEGVEECLTVFDKGIIINHNKNRANLH